jgi:hypothetical protein
MISIWSSSAQAGGDLFLVIVLDGAPTARNPPLDFGREDICEYSTKLQKFYDRNNVLLYVYILQFYMRLFCTLL